MFVEITGTEATLALPDPNRFDGEIRLRATGTDEWQVLPTSGAADGRGLGVLDMARVLRGGGRPARVGRAGTARARDHGGDRAVRRGSLVPAGAVGLQPPRTLDACWDPKARTLGSA